MTTGQGTEALTARVHKSLHRARIGVRKAGVDYFRGDGSDRFALAVLLLAIPALAAGTLGWPEWIAPTALVLPVIAGGLLLRPANLLILYAASAAALVVEAALFGPYDEGPERITPGTVLVVAAVGFSGLLIAQFRSRVGVPWRRGGTMLFDLRERIRVQSTLPALPEGWHHEMALRPAGGQFFSGDFVVASRTHGGQILEVVLTDVSGKGMDAASRALLLSGAFGGLLGSLPPHGFLPAANGYLLRQDWDEGFATSIHLVLDLESGDYELLSAGHLPALQLSAGSGRWEEKPGEGPLLGVYDGAQFDPVKGTLRPGDVLMLFTDGLVESAERDIAEGIDRLTGEADRYVASGFAGAAWHLIEAVAKDVNDDRALLLICRDA
ncbi:Stage II sporulation protein E (SpoIIE) [Streptomyces sp. 2224.1]|uniref:PP2C family protein-serine/threonine phosphatase n=1 Tax=unclassified Streptomyces TaxID=2593676 RepID=UPI0008838072|nr:MULTISPECIES: PP2C family protein-serine/threonine phosphatase [unclassified Streptomyces]PBC82412.1 stage II sporulation protein E [Streptomyces sp. 2321.6]SDR49794.1 Stage II sporulation protein E (SpoIIE) [Streptomyces sp. KS_16]SEC47546.1 Stage II sporulation protein E (SpoIIE) [Streptomyces sp. 2224.1]SEC56796.1 Stage II sporulation protein E (SpoIIE) [Streptomyces sp. 2133.1]SEE97867.1 Stage II sporulation protein E (SpoIIE) [Streptomyces sp. 2112.3]